MKLRAGALALILLGCSETPTSVIEPPDSGMRGDALSPYDVAPREVGAPDVGEDVPVRDVPPEDVARVCPTVAHAGQGCAGIDGLHCTGERVCSQCGVSAYSYFEQECVCTAGAWVCGGHDDCGATARCGYYADPMCVQPYPCGDAGADAGDDASADAVTDAPTDASADAGADATAG